MLGNMHLTQKELNTPVVGFSENLDFLRSQRLFELLQKFKDFGGECDKNLWSQIHGGLLKISEKNFSEKDFDESVSSLQRILVILSDHPELKAEGLYSFTQILKNPQDRVEILQVLDFFVNNPQLKSNIMLYSELLKQLDGGFLTVAQLKQSSFKDTVVNGLATSIDVVKPVLKLVNKERAEILDMLPAVGNKNNNLSSENLDSLLDSFKSEHATIGQLFQLLILMARLSILTQKADGLSMRDYAELSNKIRSLQLFYKEIQSNIGANKQNVFELMQEDQKAGGKHNFDRFLELFKGVDFTTPNDQKLFDQKLDGLISGINDKLVLAGFQAEQLLIAFVKNNGQNNVPYPCTQKPEEGGYGETKDRKEWFSKVERLDEDASKSLDTINASAKATYQSSSQITTSANDLMSSLINAYGAMLQGR